MSINIFYTQPNQNKNNTYNHEKWPIPLLLIILFFSRSTHTTKINNMFFT